jgi:hypothetical protein
MLGFNAAEIQAINEVFAELQLANATLSLSQIVDMAKESNPAAFGITYEDTPDPNVGLLDDPNADVQFETTADPNEGLLAADPNADVQFETTADPNEGLLAADPDAYVSNPPAGDLAGLTGNMSGLGYGSPGAPTAGAPTAGQPSDTSTTSDTITPYIPFTPPDYSTPSGGNGYSPPIYPVQGEMLTGERTPVPTPTAPVVNSQSLYDLQNFLSQGTPTPTALPPITPYVGMPVGSPTGAVSANPLPDYESIYFPTEPKKEP